MLVSVASVHTHPPACLLLLLPPPPRPSVCAHYGQPRRAAAPSLPLGGASGGGGGGAAFSLLRRDRAELIVRHRSMQHRERVDKVRPRARVRPPGGRLALEGRLAPNARLGAALRQ